MKQKEKIPINNALLNMISPMGFDYYKNKLRIGENVGKVYGITRYKENVDYGWGEPLMNIPGTIAQMSYEPLPESDASDVINNNIKVLRRKRNDTTDELQSQKLDIAIDSSQKMLKALCKEQESVGAYSTTIMAVATEEYIDKADSKLRGACTTGQHKFRLLADMQKAGYKHMSPCYVKDKDISNMLDRPAPLRSVLGGFPFASSGFNDGAGYMFGTLKDSSNASSSNMILDIWRRDQERTSSHIVFMGKTGTGKSTKLKDIILMEYAMGTRLFIIDPEREYKHLCKKLKGNWINAGGGSGKINPLQVRVLPTDPDEETEDLGLPDLAAYLMHLKSWFQMACPDITITQLNELEKILIKTYARFGMTWDTDYTSFSNTDYPIMADLLDDIQKEFKNVKEDSQRWKDLEELKGFVDNMVHGSLQFLWNGHTTIDLNSHMVVIDTHDLQNNAPDYIKGAQYYNILTWIWIEASKNRKEKSMIVGDEAYLMIDRKIPQSLIFLRNGLKRGRKYEISFVLVSHSLVDFLDESVKLYGEAILGSADIKILMGTDGKNLKDTVELYNLTEAEEETLALSQKGLALMMIGHMHMKVQFEVAEYKWEYFGSAGGR